METGPHGAETGLTGTVTEGLRTVRLQPTTGFSRVISPSELWRYRDLGRQIAARDVTVRYRQSVLGVAWAVLQPVAFMVIFSVVFGRVAGVSSNGLPYPLFSLTALVPWTFFANAVLLGSDSLVSNSALVSKVYFPRIFVPAGVVAAGLVDLAISFVVLCAIVFGWGYAPSVAILAVPLLVAIAVVAALGMTSALSAMNVRFRDVHYIVPFLVQLGLFITPIAYSSSEVAQPWRTLLAINPMAGVVEGFRWAMLDAGPAPVAMMVVSGASAIVILALGLAYFDRVERRFADLI